MTAFADELKREKTPQRTDDAMLRKAKAGHVTGGRVFGYDNVEMVGPNGNVHTSTGRSMKPKPQLFGESSNPVLPVREHGTARSRRPSYW